MRIQFPNNPLVALPLVAVLLLVARGLLGIGYHPDIFPPNYDGRVLYAAGRAWLHGLDPYKYSDLSRAAADIPPIASPNPPIGPFAYPPQSGALCVILGTLPYPVARTIWTICNLLSLAAITALAVLMYIRRSNRDRDWGPYVLAAVIIASPYTSIVAWMGQTTLIASALTMAAWYFAGERRPLIAGICLGAASFKPQLCLLVVFWLLLERDWKTLLIAAASALILALYPMMSQGPIGTFAAWHAGVSAYSGTDSNLPSWGYSVGLANFLYTVGVTTALPGSVWIGASLLLTLILWLSRRLVAESDQLPLLTAITFVFLNPIHNYDLAGVAPLFVAILYYARGNRAALVISAILLALLFAPVRGLESAGVPLPNQWRNIAVILMGTIILVSTLKACRGRVTKSGIPVGY